MINNHGHPELIELVILGLQTWHSNEIIPFAYNILEPLLKTAYKKQRWIGWKSFIEGFWTTERRLVQTDYLKHLKSQKSSILWISQVQRRMWHITWNMWEHQNIYLHNKGTTIHPIEMNVLITEICNEWEIGLDQLPPPTLQLPI